MRELNARPPLPERLVHPHEVLAIVAAPASLRAARAVGLLTLAVGFSPPAGAAGAVDADFAASHLSEVTIEGLSRGCAEVGQA
jgi:hypothetical protein